MEILTWTLYFVTWKYLDYMEYYILHPEQCEHIVVKAPATVRWLDEDQTKRLLGDVTRLLFCFYVKVFLPSIFNSVHFWNSISLIVLD